MAEYDGGGGLETRADITAKDKEGEAKYWHLQLDLAEKDHRDFLDEGRKIVKRYKSDRDRATKGDKKRFNILYSNTEVLRAAVFAKMAKPDVRRRFADRDPVGKQVANIVERAALYTQDCYDSEKVYERAIEDYLLPGRAVVRVCYEAKTAKGDGGKEYVANQELYDEYVSWEDFRHEPARTWDKVTWEAFRHRMSRQDLIDNFGKTMGERVPLNWSPKPEAEKIPDAFKRAEVWEIFDKSKRKREWVVPDFNDVLQTDDDPYGLEEFFPNAEPLQAIQGNDTFIPRPEFEIYRDQADGLDEIEARIDRLTKALKRRGVYDATFKELGRLARATDNEFIPVKNYADLTQKGGLAAAFQSEDLSTIAETLKGLHEQRDMRVQTIYDLTGISDIIRGVSDPQESATAQNIKASMGGSRLKKRQEKVQKWIRDTLRIKSEIIAEHFEPQKLAEMTGYKLVGPEQMQQMAQAQQQGQEIPLDTLITPDMMTMLRKDKLRSYRIEVETDSTVFEDAQYEKQARTELLTAVSQFVAEWFPIIQAQPMLLPLAFEMLEFGVRGYKVGRSLEDVLEQTKTQLTNVAKQAAKQPPKPDPKVQAAEIKNQGVALKAQSDQQLQQQKGQLATAEMQMEMQRIGIEHQTKVAGLQAQLQAQREEMDMLRQKMGMEMQAKMHSANVDMTVANQQHQLATHQHSLGMQANQAKHDTTMDALKQQAKLKPQGGPH